MDGTVGERSVSAASAWVTLCKRMGPARPGPVLL